MLSARITARQVRSAAAVLCVGTAGGCATRAPAVGPAVTALKSTTATVMVENNNQSDVRIYVVSNGRRVVRLGIVTAFDTRTFVWPRVIPLPAKVELIAVPVGLQESQPMPRISVEPGARLLITVEQHGRFSTLIKRP